MKIFYKISADLYKLEEVLETSLLHETHQVGFEGLRFVSWHLQ